VSVTVADSVGCSTRDTIFVNVINSTAVQEVEVNSNNYRIYPNPVSEWVQIESLNADFPIMKIVVVDVLGKVLFQQQFSTVIPKFELNLAKLPTGLYLMQVYSDKMQVNLYKIVKE
jgi:hypothetical protein